MWIIFGWEMKQKPLGVVATAYCHDCRRSSEWLVTKEAEWVTLSDIRVFRFILKHRLHYTGCSAVFPLKPAECKQIDRPMRQHESIDGTDIHGSLAKRIETEQLAGKTPLQLKFIRESMEAQEQYKAAIKSQDREVQPDRLRASISLWAEEEIRLGNLPPKSGNVLEVVLYRGELPRGDVAAIVATGERQARRVVAALLECGVLQSDSPRATLRLAFPATLASRWMPGLFPEKVG